MEMTDRFDLPVTSASAAAIGDYVAAVDLLLSANSGAAELLERALAADPDFALAHVARARLLQLQARMPYPRDALPLSSRPLKPSSPKTPSAIDHHETQLALLEELAPYWGDDWWFLGYLGQCAGSVYPQYKHFDADHHGNTGSGS
jgi:hypothetical protein